VRLLDPEVKSLSLALPRVAADTAGVLRFSAHFRDSTRSREGRIAIKNSVPDPQFTMPADLSWNGRDSLLIRPVITNLPLILASPYPELHAVWTLEGLEVDTASVADAGLMLYAPQSQGDLEVSLCLDNGGVPDCGSVTVKVEVPSTLAGAGKSPASSDPRSGYDVVGRYRREGPAFVLRFWRPRGSSPAPNAPLRKDHR